MLHSLHVPTDGLVVDPWNGAGTTTAAAAALGLDARGFDINPAAVIIGRARLICSDVADSLVPIAVEICERARTHPYEPHDDDLLRMWFGTGTARHLRTLERAAYRVLVNPDNGDSAPIFNSQLPHSALASVIYVALFRTVRELVRNYIPSNPSWIKRPTGRRIGLAWREIQQVFIQAVNSSNPFPEQPIIVPATREPAATIAVASSTELPLENDRADAVVSSPPYCTRLDYVKATLPELAVLGFTADDARQLRDRMIGTPTMSRSADDVTPTMWGAKTKALIDKIAAHKSKASATYYRKYYLQYFAGMWDSLNELRRVVKPGGSAVLVLQDSFYKDVHVDLPELIIDMSQAAAWACWKRFDFNVPRTMAAIHPGARQYRQNFRAVESAVILQR